MAYSNIIQILDRLSAHSVMRGSTASIWGLIGTLVVFILCLAIYIPAASAYSKGIYFESQFYTNQITTGMYNSNQDFKIAIVFKNKIDNKVANHKAILQYAYSVGVQVLGDSSDYYYQFMQNCSANYFSDAINPVVLEDCFIFPQNINYNIIYYLGSYSILFYNLFPKDDFNPFSGRAGAPLAGFQARMDQLLSKYYYQVYFTSKIINSAGVEHFQVHRFYSTEAEQVNTIGTSSNQIIYNVKNTQMDISIMPWINNITKSNLVWLGQIYTYAQYIPTDAAKVGVEVAFSQYMYQIVAYRYYKKLDWLIGIIGGAMLLFYIILWIPCNFINKNLHKIRNTEELLLINQMDQEIPHQTDMVRAKVPKWYWLSNFITNCFLENTQKSSKLVEDGERQLDIVHMIKKMKIIQRNLKKHKIQGKFRPKILRMTRQDDSQIQKINHKQEQVSHQGLDKQSQQNDIDASQIQRALQRQQQLIQQQTDPTFNLTPTQRIFIKQSPIAAEVYNNNYTAMIIKNDADMVRQLQPIQKYNKWSAIYAVKKNKWFARNYYRLCHAIQYFDFFGVRPNLINQPYNSSFIGILGTIAIVLLSILTVALTLSNANIQQVMILNDYKSKTDFKYTLQTGSSLKMAMCFSLPTQLQGVNRMANLKFFTESVSNGRQYINPIRLTTADYSLFDLTKATSPVSINYCFTPQSNHEVLMNTDPNNFGYFGFRVEPFCLSTPAYCNNLSNTTINNFLKFINSTYAYLFLPENRFDPGRKRVINNLAYQPLNINSRYMKDTAAMEETVFVDEVQVIDDTTNFFARKEGITTYTGISCNANTPYSLSKNIDNVQTYYQVKIRPSSNQIAYIIQTPKADTILGIIGGVFVFWYAIIHWLGKFYNNYNMRAKLADQIYDEDGYNECPVNKVLTNCPIPNCLLPTCLDIKSDVQRMKLVDKKILNDLNYLWLVKYVDNCYRFSSALWANVYSKNLSLVFIKEKIDQAEEVKPLAEEKDDVEDQDFIQFNDLEDFDDQKTKRTTGKMKNKVANQKINDSMGDMRSLDSQKRKTIQKPIILQKIEDLNQNRINGHLKPFKLAWMDTFQYPSSLTFKGKRQVTSCCGGFSCIILMIFIIVIANFQVGIYLDRSDTKVSMSTDIMQPIQSQQHGAFNNQINLRSNSNFKLAITFSKAYHDFPHDVSGYTNTIGFSIFQKTFTKLNGVQTTVEQQHPLVRCNQNYLKSWAGRNVDLSYYDGTQFGYCLPDGVQLVIDGTPQDRVTKNFVISIFDKLGTAAGKLAVQLFLQNYFPKYHFSIPLKDFQTRKITYEITSLAFDPPNITYPVLQNLTLSKMVILYDDMIALEGDPLQHQTYNFNPFRQFETAYYGLLTENMYYNLTFDNSYLVQTYKIQGDKFYQTWGIIGGLIAFFIFGFGVFPRAFNHYRMKYLIGREFYHFDMLKSKEAKVLARRKGKKSREQVQSLSQQNNMSEGKVFAAFLLSFIGGLTKNYNITDVLRRVTLIQQRVEQDMSLYQFYKKLHLFRDQLNQHQNNHNIKLTDIYFKPVYNPSPDPYQIGDTVNNQGRSNQNPLKSYAKKYNWTSTEQYIIYDALINHVKISQVFDSTVLERAFTGYSADIGGNLSELGGTVGSIGTASMANQSQIAQQQRD